MPHVVMRKGPWFRAKRRGYGAGLPIYCAKTEGGWRWR